MTDTLKPGMSAVAWARENGEEFRVSTHVDNYEPPRDWASLTMYRYRGHDGEVAYLLEDGIPSLRDAHQAGYLLDDGATVTPLYVAGWHNDHGYVILHKFPVNVDESGAPRVRPDGRPVDFSTWMLGPRRYYHLKEMW